jgi:hypothetical protein
MPCMHASRVLWLLLAWPAVPVPAVAAPPAAPAPPARSALPFLQDDYPKALALARARKLPLFIEAWAPW